MGGRKGATIIQNKNTKRSNCTFRGFKFLKEKKGWGENSEKKGRNVMHKGACVKVFLRK